MTDAYREILNRARRERKEFKAYFARLKKLKPGRVDPLMKELHDEVFEEIDCLQCSNCCRGTGPLPEGEGYQPPFQDPEHEAGGLCRDLSQD